MESYDINSMIKRNEKQLKNAKLIFSLNVELNIPKWQLDQMENFIIQQQAHLDALYLLKQ